MGDLKYVKPKVAEQILGVNRRTLQKWAESGAIQYIRPGGTGPWLYDVGSVRNSSSSSSFSSSSVSNATTGDVRSEPSQESLGASGGGGGGGETTAAASRNFPSEAQAAALRITAASARKEEEKRDYIYARVSTRRQSDDLKSQIATLQLRHPGCLVLSDCGSGLNFKRKGLKTLLELATKGRVRSVFVAHKDRLCRFAFDLVEHILKLNGATIVVDSYETDSASNPISPELELAEDVLAIVTVFGARLYGKRSAGGRQRRRDAIAALEAAEESENREGEEGGGGRRRRNGAGQTENGHREAETSD